jgi:hypothetical protein
MRARLHVAFIAAIALMLATASLAEATHLETSKWRNYFYNGHNVAVWFCFDAGYPTGNHRYRFFDGANAWNNAKSELYYIWDCGEIIVYWKDITFPFDNYLARAGTIGCVTPPEKHCTGWVEIDKFTNWYLGVGGIGLNQYDLRSLASHEMGHLNAFRHEFDDDTYVMWEFFAKGEIRYIPKCHEANSIRSMYGAEPNSTPRCR